MPPPLHVRFTGSAAGAEPGDKKPQWRVVSCTAVKGEGLPDAETMTVIEGTDATKSSGASAWTVHGTTSNVRYTTRPELKELAAVQEGLGRPQATQAALIVIKKNEEWWSLAQGEKHGDTSRLMRAAASMEADPPGNASLLHQACFSAIIMSQPM